MVIIVRPAGEQDLPQVRDIFAHYVLDTVVSFLVQDPPLQYIADRYHDSTSRKLPYLVAIDQSTNQVTGYASASAFRGFMLGYGHTVEITLFCHPQHTRQGIGTLLIRELLSALKMTTHLTKEMGHEENQVEFQIKKVMAIMAVDVTAQNAGLALCEWYKRWDFEEIGRLKGVGSKKGMMYA